MTTLEKMTPMESSTERSHETLNLMQCWILLNLFSLAFFYDDESIYGAAIYLLDAALDLRDPPAVVKEKAYRALHPDACSDLDSEPNFLRYDRPDSNCPGEGHTTLEIACGFGEALVLNRTFVLDNSMCVGRAHLDVFTNMDDFSTSLPEYFDFDELTERGVRFTTLSGFRNLLAQGCIYRLTPKKSLRQRATRDVIRSSAVSTKALLNRSDINVLTRDFHARGRRKAMPAFSVCNRWHTRPVWPIPARHLRVCAHRMLAILGDDFYSVHVRRGDKLRLQGFSELDRDTRPDNIRARLRDKVPYNATLYIITNERDAREFFRELASVWQLRLSGDDVFKPILRDVKNSYQVTRAIVVAIA
jgi:hypothetical protein